MRANARRWAETEGRDVQSLGQVDDDVVVAALAFVVIAQLEAEPSRLNTNHRIGAGVKRRRRSKTSTPTTYSFRPSPWPSSVRSTTNRRNRSRRSVWLRVEEARIRFSASRTASGETGSGRLPGRLETVRVRFTRSVHGYPAKRVCGIRVAQFAKAPASSSASVSKICTSRRFLPCTYPVDASHMAAHLLSSATRHGGGIPAREAGRPPVRSGGDDHEREPPSLAGPRGCVCCAGAERSAGSGRVAGQQRHLHHRLRRWRPVLPGRTEADFGDGHGRARKHHGSCDWRPYCAWVVRTLGVHGPAVRTSADRLPLRTSGTIPTTDRRTSSSG